MPKICTRKSRWCRKAKPILTGSETKNLFLNRSNQYHFENSILPSNAPYVQLYYDILLPVSLVTMAAMFQSIL